MITFDTKNDILTTKGESDFVKSSKLVNELGRHFQAQKDPHQYLVKICNVLRSQEHQRLREITNYILKQLGK